MFRVVVIVGIAVAPVILLALLVDPLVGAILFGVEIGVAIGFLLQRSRGTEPRTAEVASSDDAVHRVLVVANQTVGGRALLDEIKRRVAGEDAQRDPGRGAAARGLGRRALVVGRRRGHSRRARAPRGVAWRRCAEAGLEVTGSWATITTRIRTRRTRCGRSRPTR